MASSSSSNRKSSSKNSKLDSFLNLSRSKNSSSILKVKEMPTQLQLIRDSTQTSKKWYDVIVKNPKSCSRNLKKSRSSVPIVCRHQCPQNSCCIRITNLTRRITALNLRHLFSDFGTIKKLDLHFNFYDRISKGFSYIMFSTSEESENAVRNMNKCEIDGHEITCELWFLPYTEYQVSSILHGASSGDRYQRSPTRRVSLTNITQGSSQQDGLSSNYGPSYPINKSLSRSSIRSCSRSPRQSRLRSRSNHHRKRHSMRSNRSRDVYLRKPY